MDKGAHFYQSDFQIHSPRDRNWQPADNRPKTDEERLRYAQGFIAKCREVGIKAIGITDHDDVCFVKYFQLAAQDETPKIEAINPEKQNPIVFPGVEIASKVGYQVIVLLDANADESLQHILLHTVGVTPVTDAEETGPEPRALNFVTLNELDDLLTQRRELRRRYVILPHVGIDGYKTLAKRSLREIYAAMPCVGGYIECTIGQLKRRNIFLFDGKLKGWGDKPIGFFQTSDFRDEAATYDGSRSTWVKFSIPTAEALRQACLARQSRIKQIQPLLPSVYIQKVAVSDSIFLGPIELEFNPQFNAVIGGRGTGKTSILEYVRHAMQDQPTIDDPSLHDEISEKRESIIHDTLLKCNGIVTIHWIKNNVLHKVCFNQQVGKPTLAIGDGEQEEVTPENLRTMLPIQAYSQKQLSTVGTRTQELQRFIEQPIQDELAEYDREIADKRKLIEHIYDHLIDLKEKSKMLSALRTDLKSIQAQANSIEQSIPQISPELQKALKENPIRLREKQIIEVMQEDILSIESALDQAIKTISELPRDIDVDETNPQQSLILNIHKRTSELIRKVSTSLQTIQTTLSKDINEVNKEVARWEIGQNEHHELYKKATEQASEHKQKLEQIGTLRKQEANIQKKISELEKQVEDLDKVRKEFDESWDLWTSIHRKKGDIVEQACRTLTEKSDGEIVAEIIRGGDIEKAIGVLEDVLRGCNIREQNWTNLKETLHQENHAEAWKKLMDEIRPLAEMSEDEIPSDGTVPEIQIWSLTSTMRKNIVERLKPRQWLDVALTSLEDLPVFYYKPRDSEQRIEFKNASAGQQATALLKVLLKEISGPLIIDQPEEDLDNEIIRDIAEEIWTAKERRQIIFASHNANIVVNGDAELVIWCAYRETGDSTKGHIKGQGAIDIPEIREAITNVMEGGQKAFELRKQKYGF